ncbi:MAG: HNH endonuclease [bacterium]
MSELAICIYCMKDSSGVRSLEHVIPEALGCKETLPKGYVCDDCNNYFSEMDKCVLLNRYIALHVGAEEIRGKRGKIRRQIGERLRFPEKGAFEIILGPRTITPGTQKVEFELEQSKEFDELLFARGIHKMAFNSYTSQFGRRDALRSRFDNLRRYVRRADRDELWPYGVRESQYKESKFIAIFHRGNPDEVVGLHILGLEFLISLTGWTREIQKRLREDDISVIHENGQWQESSLLGLKRH